MTSITNTTSLFSNSIPSSNLTLMDNTNFGSTQQLELTETTSEFIDLTGKFSSETFPETETQDYTTIPEDTFVRKKDYALENPVKDEALKRLDYYLSTFADIQSDLQLLSPETIQTEDKEEELNNIYQLLLKLHCYDEIKYASKPSPTLEAISSFEETEDKELPTLHPNSLFELETQSEFDHTTYTQLHKQYITYFSSVLKQYHDTYKELLNAIETFSDLKEWIKRTPAKATLTKEFVNNAIDTTISELNLPFLLETLTHLSKRLTISIIKIRNIFQSTSI